MSKYTGHGPNTGGLQQHSIGGSYPNIVFGQETDYGTRYGVMNAATGAIVHTATFDTARDAGECAARRTALSNAHRTIRTIIGNGGHHA